MEIFNKTSMVLSTIEDIDLRLGYKDEVTITREEFHLLKDYAEVRFESPHLCEDGDEDGTD